MVKKKSTPVKRVYVRAKTKRRTHRKSGVSMIPAAAATVGLAVALAGPVKTELTKIKSVGVKRCITDMMDTSGGAFNRWLGKDQLIKDGVGLIGGYTAGYLVKKYGPTAVKGPLGKIAKKIPKVI